MKKVFCYSYCEFCKLMEDNGWNDNNLPTDIAFISIGSGRPKDNEPHYFKENHDNVINLDFDDITDYTLEGWIGVKGMSDEQAQELLEFIENNVGKHFYVHCSAGVSRSQAVCRFIVDTYDEYCEESLRKDNPCLYPNVHVLSLLRRKKWGL